MLKEIKKGFTLAEVLIVIGIIGVVAALTLPNLNHATGDKETVTRLQKAYSILSEANDRAVAIYGPISTWFSSSRCTINFRTCYMERIGEFLKVSKRCNEQVDESDSSYADCTSLNSDMVEGIVIEMSDGITFTADDVCQNCECHIGEVGSWTDFTDICIQSLRVDINGPKKGKNSRGTDEFRFFVSDSLGVLPFRDTLTLEDQVDGCMEYKDDDYCNWWIMEYGNLDYLKADNTGKCNDSNIILDGTTNTSCH